MIKIKRGDFILLHLPLKREWYDMIASGEKREEYRDYKLYWVVRIRNAIEKSRPIVAAFSLGRHRATMFFKVSAIKAVCGSNHPEWGEPKYIHYVIALGERITKNDGETGGGSHGSRNGEREACARA